MFVWVKHQIKQYILTEYNQLKCVHLDNVFYDPSCKLSLAIIWEYTQSRKEDSSWSLEYSLTDYIKEP